MYVDCMDTVSPSERLVLEDVKKYDATAVYFRRFVNDRPSVPQILIYDYTTLQIKDNKIADLHRRLWCYGQVPIIFIFTNTQVKIFNALKRPKFDDENYRELKAEPLATIVLASEIEKELKSFEKFSAKLFDNGTFWENSEFKNKFNREDSAYETILLELKQFRSEFIIDNPQHEESIINKLLVLSIFIKYLEERKGENDERVFPDNYFKQFNNSMNFVEVLRNNACIQLFEKLGQHFNGKIFRLFDSEKKDLETLNLSKLADFLEGNLTKKQYSLWPLYSFNDLPIELISNIYQEFLVKVNRQATEKKKKNEGIVYTPPHLVQFLVDEAMSIDKPKDNFKVLDPACGSGIFLVAAYNRLVQWWRLNNNFKKPDLDTLKKILFDNIYGVDVSEEAIRVTIFSLSLALCDMVSPNIIWNKLKFDDLGVKNLKTIDFFKLVYSKKINKRFDLIIGNPPFVKKDKWSNEAKKIEKERITENQPPVTGGHLALLLLDQSILLCKENGIVCLILPAGALLYNKNSFDYRRFFLEKYDVPQIIDFTHISRVLFGQTGDIPTSAIYAVNRPKKSGSLLHVTIRRTKPAKEKLYFELDYYDFHYISRVEAISNRHIWKANFLGGGRILNFVLRFQKFKKFKKFIENKIEEQGWVFCEGYKSTLLKHNVKENEKNKFINLKGSKVLPTKAFTSEGIDKSRFINFEDNKFISNEKALAFKAPHILIKESIEDSSNYIPIEFLDQDIAFEGRILGIHAPEKHMAELLDVEKRLKRNKTYLLYIASTSNEFLIGQSTTILKADIENLPWPDNTMELNLSNTEEILYEDLCDYILEFRRRGENSKVLQKVRQENLDEFGNIFCQVLNSVYQNKNRFFKAEPYVNDSFVCFPFNYGQRVSNSINFDSSKDLESELNGLLNKKNESTRINRILKLYDENSIYFIKPNQLRYWLRSIAIRDADETFSDLIQQGY